MPPPLSLHHLVNHMASEGYGWEDIAMRLRIPGEIRLQVRQQVLGISARPDAELAPPVVSDSRRATGGTIRGGT